MTLRSIVLSTAALLLLTAAAPGPLGFSPSAVHAQSASAEVVAALSGDPAQLQPKQLRERIATLREAVESGALKGAERKAAREKIKAYRTALEQHRGERQQAKQEAEQPKAQQQKSERQAERQAQKSERKAEKQAQKAERKAEKQAQKQQPAQQAQGGLTREMVAAIEDRRPASALQPAELRSRIETLRGALDSGVLPRDERRKLQARIKSDREALQTIRAERKEPEKAAKKSEKTEASKAKEAPKAEVDKKARAILADKKPAGRLSDKELRQRLSDNRAVLASGKLSREEERQLRTQLRQDREELRSRVASEQKKPRDRADDSDASPSKVTVILEQRTPSDRLSERELEQRIRILTRAVKAGKITVRQAEVANLLIGQDRRELRKRLHAGRDKRRESRRQARARNEVFIDFHVGYRPPPVIFAAEAMPRDIEVQLIAPPLRQVSRTYTVHEIAVNPDIREAMPGIEIDTLNFDFGSAEVRPEEIDKLDEIAEVIERIVAQRPDEVFLLEGHTDAVGSDAANDVLSQHRAEAVKQALVEYYDIDPQNLQTVGLGKRFLKIVTPDPEEENRRVTVRRITPLLAGHG